MQELGFFAYIIECADSTLYSGWTLDPARRLDTHNAGKGSKYTRSRLPVKFAAVWQFPDKIEAMRFEARLKRLSRAKKRLLILEASDDEHRQRCVPTSSIRSTTQLTRS